MIQAHFGSALRWEKEAHSLPTTTRSATRYLLIDLFSPGTEIGSMWEALPAMANPHCPHRSTVPISTDRSDRECLAGATVKIFRCELYKHCSLIRYKDGQSARICQFCDQK